MQLLNIILFWIFFGSLCAFLAHRVGKNPTKWFFVGLFLGLIGVLTLIGIFLIEKRMGNRPTPTQTPQKIPPISLPKEVEQLWYYLDPSRQSQGPIEFSELSRLWNEQQVTEQSYLWTEGMGQWKRVRELTELLPLLVSDKKI